MGNFSHVIREHTLPDSRKRTSNGYKLSGGERHLRCWSRFLRTEYGADKTYDDRTITGQVQSQISQCIKGHRTSRQCRFEPSQTSNFVKFSIFDFFFFFFFLLLHILKAYGRMYQLAKFHVVVLLNVCVNADSNLVRTVLSPEEKHRNVLNHAPRACAQVVSASCSQGRVYKSNTLNAYRFVTNQTRLSGGFTLRA